VNEIDRLLARGAVLLEPAGPAQPTEYGKGWLDRWADLQQRFNATIRDIGRLALKELWDWDRIQGLLDAEGVLQAAISSGVSQGQMQALINATTKNATYTAPAAFAMALMINAPTSTTTGVLGANEATYTNYTRTAATMGAASAATPSVATNTSTITFPNCGATGATLLGFIMADSLTTNAGNAIWYGTLTSTVISSTQTPPTIAAGALSLSMTGT
jgi:hypothetical protein